MISSKSISFDMADSSKLSAIVLVGGVSSRMGRFKTTLPMGGTTLIERLVAELRRAFVDIVVVAAPESVAEALPALDAAVIRDQVAFGGPAQALLLGLRSIRHDIAFACACDLPMLNADIAAWLGSILEEKHDAVIPMVGGCTQVLHAVYRKRCADALEGMLARGGRSLRRLAPLLEVRSVTEHELRPFDPELRSFFNLNTREDYEAALRLIEPRAKRS
ncbi:MAG: molybdenum cofactor guanylyltransferase [Candidatus Binataceae bacterium]